MTCYELGATLFVPANHHNLAAIISREKYPNLRSLLINFEDGFENKHYHDSLKNLSALLLNHKKNSLYIFIRPANQNSLQDLLALEGIEKIDGFILPKFSLANTDSYLQLLLQTPFYFMPSIEGKELFDKEKLTLLREKLLPYKEKIPAIRIGCEDMLKQLGIWRDCTLSLFELTAPSYLLGMFIATFKPYGFCISGCVYPCFKDIQGFRKDVQRDLQEGLFSKTIIHPNQIDIVHECYKVSKEEYEKATHLLKTQSAVFNHHDTMAEVATQKKYATIILERASLYGLQT